MFRRHSSHRLAAHLDGQLASEDERETELHLEQCADCRDEREKIGSGMQAIEHLPLVEAPEAIWLSIQAASRQHQWRQMQARRWLRWGFATVVLLVLAGAAYWRMAHRPDMRWQVTPLAGVPSIAGKPFHQTAHIAAGEWIETDARSRATVKVGQIGSVEVAPNTRLRVVTELPGEHRLALLRGQIQAKISAPPKLFFVDTGSGTAVDLGCEYSLSTDEDGSGMLRVTKGWVSFQWKTLESLVPAGASCRTRAHLGPAIPYFDDAPENLKQAVDSFGFEKSVDGGMDVILLESRVRDTLTLWHLLSRVDLRERERVYDRIAALTPIPPGVTRELVLKLDPQALEHLKDELAWTW